MSTREAAYNWVLQSLAKESIPRSAPLLTDADIAQARELLAENLLLIAEENEVPTEILVQWIHTGMPSKQWTTLEWRRWCDKYTSARAELFQLQRHPDWRKLCPQCFAHVALREGEHWICPQCGEVQ